MLYIVDDVTREVWQRSQTPRSPGVVVAREVTALLERRGNLA